MSFLADTPIRSDRQAGRQAGQPSHCPVVTDSTSGGGTASELLSGDSAIARPRSSPLVVRCWADASTVITEKVAVECQALGTGRLGLCERHQRELLGEGS